MEITRAATMKHPPRDSAATMRKLFTTPAEITDGGEVLENTHGVYSYNNRAYLIAQAKLDCLSL